MAKNNILPRRKIPQTPDFVKGLLASSNLIGAALPDSPRWLAQRISGGKSKIAKLDPEQRQELGEYQSRVVLAGLAAELALKWLWEKGNQSCSAKSCHDLSVLFNELSEEIKGKVRAGYLKRVCPSEQGWDSVDNVFKICKHAFVDWRYIVEKGGFKDYIMHVTYLNHATRAVLEVGDTLPQQTEEQ